MIPGNGAGEGEDDTGVVAFEFLAALFFCHVRGGPSREYILRGKHKPHIEKSRTWTSVWDQISRSRSRTRDMVFFCRRVEAGLIRYPEAIPTTRRVTCGPDFDISASQQHLLSPPPPTYPRTILWALRCVGGCPLSAYLELRPFQLSPREDREFNQHQDSGFSFRSTAEVRLEVYSHSHANQFIFSKFMEFFSNSS